MPINRLRQFVNRRFGLELEKLANKAKAGDFFAASILNKIMQSSSASTSIVLLDNVITAAEGHHPEAIRTLERLVHVLADRGLVIPGECYNPPVHGGIVLQSLDSVESR